MKNTIEIKIDENYRCVKLFESIKKGEVYLIPFEQSRHNGIKTEAVRQNREARLKKELKGKMDIKYRVSYVEYPGYTALIRIK